MLEIESYLERIASETEKHPGILSNNVSFDNRGDVVYIVKGSFIFHNRYEFHFSEYWIYLDRWTLSSYSYHYQSNDKKTVFRYDNSPHHPEIETFPRHRHSRSGTVSSSHMIDLFEALHEAIRDADDPKLIE